MSPIYIAIDQEETGRNISRLMARKGLRVRDIQEACGFEKPQAVYKWIHGQTLPSIDNLLILSRIFKTDMEGILAVSGDALPHFCGGICTGKTTFVSGVYGHSGQNFFSSIRRSIWLTRSSYSINSLFILAMST